MLYKFVLVLGIVTWFVGSLAMIVVGASNIITIFEKVIWN